MNAAELDEIDCRLHTARSFAGDIKQRSDGQHALNISVEVQQAMDHLSEAIRMANELRPTVEFDGGGRRV